MSGEALERVPPHLVRRGVLDETEHAALLDWAVANEAAFAPSRIGAGAEDAGTRTSLSVPVDRQGAWRDTLREHMRGLVPGLAAELGMAAFDVHAMDADMVAYRDRAFFRQHVDVSVRGTREASDRVLTIVYYFHRLPQGFSGGALRIHALRGGAHMDLVPEANSLVAFPAWVPHEVLPVSVPSRRFGDGRFAINFWARRKRTG